MVKDKPDFYGPVWILITLIFSLTVLANLAKYLSFAFSSGEIPSDQATFKFNLLLKSSMVCFGTWLLAPATLLLFLFLFGQRPNSTQIAEMYSIWGYSYIFYIFATFISIIPSKVTSSHPVSQFLCFLRSFCRQWIHAPLPVQRIPEPVPGKLQIHSPRFDYWLADSHFPDLPIHLLLIYTNCDHNKLYYRMETVSSLLMLSPLVFLEENSLSSLSCTSLCFIPLFTKSSLSILLSAMKQ